MANLQARAKTSSIGSLKGWGRGCTPWPQSRELELPGEPRHRQHSKHRAPAAGTLGALGRIQLEDVHLHKAIY